MTYQNYMTKSVQMWNYFSLSVTNKTTTTTTQVDQKNDLNINFKDHDKFKNK